MVSMSNIVWEIVRVSGSSKWYGLNTIIWQIEMLDSFQERGWPSNLVSRAFPTKPEGKALNEEVAQPSCFPARFFDEVNDAGEVQCCRLVAIRRGISGHAVPQGYGTWDNWTMKWNNRNSNKRVHNSATPHQPDREKKPQVKYSGIKGQRVNDRVGK